MSRFTDISSRFTWILCRSLDRAVLSKLNTSPQSFDLRSGALNVSVKVVLKKNQRQSLSVDPLVRRQSAVLDRRICVPIICRIVLYQLTYFKSYRKWREELSTVGGAWMRNCREQAPPTCLPFTTLRRTTPQACLRCAHTHYSVVRPCRAAFLPSSIELFPRLLQPEFRLVIFHKNKKNGTSQKIRTSRLPSTVFEAFA